jgi:DNA polymerase III subunit epsilon
MRCYRYMDISHYSYSQKRAILLSKKLVTDNALILDTETTGLGYKDEVIEITIINMEGFIIINTLVKPTILMHPSATAIHGISNFELYNAPYIIQILPKVKELFEQNDIVIYNAPFDLRLLKQSANAHGEKFPYRMGKNIFCAMELYATYNGEYDLIKKCYRWVNLGAAAKKMGISVPDKLHRTLADVEITRQIIIKMASIVI